MFKIFRKKQKNTEAMPYDTLLCDVDLSAMNLHERRAFEKTRPHKCNECGEVFTGWTSDNYANDYLTCFCPKCKTKNHYSYWGYCYHNAT